MAAYLSLSECYPQVKLNGKGRTLQRKATAAKRAHTVGDRDYDLVLKLVLLNSSSPRLVLIAHYLSREWKETVRSELTLLFVQACRWRCAVEKRLNVLLPSIEQRTADASSFGVCRRCLNVLAPDTKGASFCAGCQCSIDEWLASSQACPAEAALGFPLLHCWGDECFKFCKLLAEAAAYGNELALQLIAQQSSDIRDAGAFGACCLHNPLI